MTEDDTAKEQVPNTSSGMHHGALKRDHDHETEVSADAISASVTAVKKLSLAHVARGTFPWNLRKRELGVARKLEILETSHRRCVPMYSKVMGS